MHRYEFDHLVHSLAFKYTQDASVQLAVGSLNMERASNSIQILKIVEATTTSIEQPQQPQSTKRLVKITELPHEYPPSKIQWAPDTTRRTDFLATAGECVRIFQVDETEAQVKPVWEARHAKGRDHDSPLTCFEWSSGQPSMLATTSLSGVCCLWDLNTLKQVHELMAHQSQANSITFTAE